ncbi:hypothetical protein SDC9_168595 [bioreactor metagenome]|uniref:Uncharacterized protein n=1 Tax=bioreactor metagenome TaxID=1076179 RepID=A0A645G507_9ZZZZ
MDYSCTIRGCDKVAGNNPECPFTGVYPRNQLFVDYTTQLGTFHNSLHNPVRHNLVARFVLIHGGLSPLRIE